MLMAEWQGLRRGRPGRRFREQYESARQSKKRTTVIGRVVRIGSAVIAFAVGVVLMFIPGPAVLFFLIAGALLATESRALAISLDRLEVGIRVIATAGCRRWRRLGLGGRIIVLVGGAAISVAAIVIGWRIAFR